MIAYVAGTLVEKHKDAVVVETGGMGYKIFVSPITLSQLPPSGNEVKIFTSFVVSEDAQRLYGFLTQTERELFEKLLKIPKIGPKMALLILSQPYEKITQAIAHGDAGFLQQIPGIGKKIATQVILELKEKLQAELLVSADAEQTFAENSPSSLAVQALISLGYSPSSAREAVFSIHDREKFKTSESLVKEALRHLGSATSGGRA